MVFELAGVISSSVLESLPTPAQSCDHVIVRNQKTMSKGRPKTPLKSCSVVTDPRV